MKNVVKLILLTSSLILGSCLPSNKGSSSQTSGDETSSIDPSGSSTTGTSDTSDTSSSTSEEQPDTSKLEAIYLNKREFEVQETKRYDDLIVSKYVWNIPESEVTDELKAVTWSISDTNIATVDQYGRVTGKNSGKTTVICTSVEGSRKAYATVFVYPSGGSVTKKWKKISSNSDLSVGDQLIFACPEKGMIATEECTGMYLHSSSATFSSDKTEITNTSSAAKFVFGDDYKGRGGYTFEIPEREDGTYLATTNQGKVSFYDTPKVSAVLWDVHYDTAVGAWDIRSHSPNVDGWFMYNVDTGGFTTYTSNPTQFMFYISIYKLTRV